MEEEKKKQFFVRIFDISPCVFTQISIERAHWMRNFIPHPTSTHNAYCWRTPLPQKQDIPEKMWWWHHHHVFRGISCFWGSGVHQKYAVWVLVGCKIKFCIQQALPIEIWVKTQWDMSKIRTKKVVFLITNMSIQPLWLTYFIEILLVLEFQLTKTYFCTFSYKAHFRPQISSNVWDFGENLRLCVTRFPAFKQI